VGYGEKLHAFERSMNRAVERAAPEAKSIFLYAVKQYVTERALHGLFLMLAEEEAKIRRNHEARITDQLKRVFGKE